MDGRGVADSGTIDDHKDAISALENSAAAAAETAAAVAAPDASSVAPAESSSGGHSHSHAGMCEVIEVSAVIVHSIPRLPKLEEL